jgi:hypothetical protein
MKNRFPSPLHLLIVLYFVVVGLILAAEWATTLR